MTQYRVSDALNSTIAIPELKPFTAIYDSAVENARNGEESAPLAGLTYVMIATITITSVALQVYTASRLIRRHPNFTMSLTALIVGIVVIILPNYMIPRIFDTRVVGTFIACALIFDVIAIAWVYGVKNIYTDLEFSIGRPISKLWAFFWCATPIVVGSVLTWWAVNSSESDLGSEYIPRWLPIAISIAIIICLACSEVYKQVDYNCCNMIREAGVSSKDWGPADPIVRHAWKQWTDVCEDTGQKDFTLRRRGTRDYTHSIKRGQRMNGGGNTKSHYPNAAYSIKTSTLNRSSPKYNGSIFGDSAIEEDISVTNYPHVQRVVVGGEDDHNINPVAAISTPKQPTPDSHKMLIRLQPTNINHTQRINVRSGSATSVSNVNLQRNHSNLSNHSHHSGVVDVSSGFGLYTDRPTRIVNSGTTPRHPSKPLNSFSTENYGSLQRAKATNVLPPFREHDNEHICWRKYNGPKREEFSTEL